MADPARKIVNINEYAQLHLKAGWKAPMHPRPEFELTWPSGSGAEVGTVSVSLQEVWQRATTRANDHGLPFQVFDVTEDGMQAIVLLGLVDTPISFVDEAEVAPGLLSVVVDKAADLNAVSRAIRDVLGLSVSLSPADGT